MKIFLSFGAILLLLILWQPGFADTISGTAERSPAGNDNSSKIAPARHGKIDGSFTNGKLTLSKYVAKNGFHQGCPVIIIVDEGSHFTYVLQKQDRDKVVEVLRASNAIGKIRTATPYGRFRVVQKLKWPSWLPPKSIDPKQKAIQPYNKDHKNPLGVARITLDKWDISLHGTNDPHSIRHDVSHGCIRHSNRDILSIFNMTPVGTRVILTKHLAGMTLTKADFESRHTRAG